MLNRLAVLCLMPALAAADAGTPTPVELFPGLFERVQMERVFEDGKTFVDAVPRTSPAEILRDYDGARTEAGFDLRAFVSAHFDLPAAAAGEYSTDLRQDVAAHIDALWPVLERRPGEARPNSSLVALPFRYVVPGGRFREIYYWDSYFTMLGLEESGRHDLATDMVNNFAWLIDRFGHVPNGNRSYYLTRSQPPFFASMVELLAARDGADAYRRYLPQLRREYEFWMAGLEELGPGQASRRVVRLADGSVLNRYWDDRDIPREESWREDVETARASRRPQADVYRNLRAAAESGWDFSSRWLGDGRTLATIRTVEIVPVDLNSLLYGVERTLERACRAAARPAEAAQFAERAENRRRAMARFLWDPVTGVFEDYDRIAAKRTGRLSAATLYPLFTGLATAAQARAISTVVERRLLEPDGVATTTVRTGQQWDAPNGWAPLQWIAIDGLNRYGQRRLARKIAARWIRENVGVYRSTGKLVEKYDISGDDSAKGGEYPLQDGFGWTNGVLRRLLALYPDARPAAIGSKAEGAVP